MTYNGWHAIKLIQTKSYTFNLYVLEDFALKGWYAIKLNQIKPNVVR